MTLKFAVNALPAGASGRLTVVQELFDGVDADGLDGALAVVLSPDDQHLYATGREENAVAVFSRDPGSGMLTFVEALFDGVGPVSGIQGAWTVAVTPDGQHVYVTGESGHSVAAFERDEVSGELTFVNAYFANGGPIPGLSDSTALGMRFRAS